VECPVRFAECDVQGVVFNAHYLTWVSEAIQAWWQSVGLARAGQELGAESLVKASTLEWSSSACYGDVVAVDAELDRLGRTGLTIAFTIRVEQRVCCVVRTTYVSVRDGVAVPWSEGVRARISGR
jgi:acyl-CoA thioester hydrolase